MGLFVNEFGQLYDALLSAYPALKETAQNHCIYQFSAMPVAPDWPLKGGRSAIADLSSPTRDGFYQVGAGRVTRAYQSLLSSLDPVRGENLAQEVASALSQMENASADVACDLNADIERWKSLQTPMLNVHVDSSIPCDNDWTRLYNGQGGAGFSTILNGPCRYTFTAQGLGVYTVQRGRWYRERFVTPTFPIAEGGNLTTADFFGRGGTLQHVTYRVVVVWKPQVILTLPREALPAFLPGANSLEENQHPAGILGLDFNFLQVQILPAANGMDDDNFSLLLPGGEPLQLWGIQSATHYM